LSIESRIRAAGISETTGLVPQLIYRDHFACEGSD
jgi:hypothetical protein